MKSSKTAKITKERVDELLEYRDGKLYWKTDTQFSKRKGKEAGCERDGGYVVVGIDRTLYRAHRLIFLLFNGYVPKYVDHVNGDPRDNRIENLREVDAAQNRWNSVHQCRSQTGHKNVNKTRYGKYEVKLMRNYENHYVGVFETLDEAVAAADKAREALHGDYARS
jgi:hypothetical protein